jgi:hypothetical protein
MAQQDKTTYEGTFNNAVTGLYKTNTTKDIVSSRLRTHITNTKDSVPFTVDDSYTWPFPQVTASGTDTYAATLSPVITAYATGQKFQIKFTNASSGVSTLNLNALGAKKIYINPTTQATTGHIVAGQISLLVYDAALDTAAGGFLMIGAPSTAGGGGTVESVSGTTNRIDVDNTDPDNPIIDIDAAYDAAITAEIAAAIAAATLLGSVSTSVAGGTITLDMDSTVQRIHVGSATFATAKIIAMSNTTGSLSFQFIFEVTNVAAVLTVPADWLMITLDFDGADWTPPATGKYVMGGSWNGTNWFVNVAGPYI